MSSPDSLRARLDNRIDLRHPLAVLANQIPWTQIEAVAHERRPAPEDVLDRLRAL